MSDMEGEDQKEEEKSKWLKRKEDEEGKTR